MANRTSEDTELLFDRLRPTALTATPRVELDAGIQPVGWTKIEDADSNQIAAIGRQVWKPAAVGIAHNLWTKVTGYTSTPVTGVGTTYNAYGGGEIRVDVPGVFLIVAHIEWAASVGGVRRIMGVSFNASATPLSAPLETNWDTRLSSSEPMHANASWVVPMSANDTVALFLYQNSGGPLNSEDAVLSIFRLGV